MLHYAIVSFATALIAAVLGFRSLTGLSMEVGSIFAVLCVILLAVAVFTGRGSIVTE